MGRQALPGVRSTIFMVDPEDLTIAGRDTSNRKHCLWDPRGLVLATPEMTQSIRKHGVKVPVIVRKVDDYIEVVDGRQRVVNCRAANIELIVDGLPPHKVPVRLEHGTDVEAFETMVITNAFTRSVSPIESAHLVQRYLAFEKTEEDAAQTFGVTTRTIKNWLLMLKLDPIVQRAVNESRLSATAAVKLARLPRKEQKAQLKTVLESVPQGQKVSVTRVARETGNASATQRAPSKKLVHRMLAHTETFDTLSSQFILGVRWAVGDATAQEVTGLRALLRRVKK